MPRQVEQTRFVLSEDKRYLLLAFPELFKGVRVVIVPRHWARGKYISLFDKSPPDIVCPSFWELKWLTCSAFSLKLSSFSLSQSISKELHAALLLDTPLTRDIP